MPIGMFIDGEYLQKTYGAPLDFLKLRQHIEKDIGDHVDEAYFFSADQDPPKAMKLHKALTLPPPAGPGFRTKLYWLRTKALTWPRSMGGGPVLHPSSGKQYELTTQKGVDVGLAFHMIRSFYKRKWTRLVLGAGDADFHEPVQTLVEVENVDLYLIGQTANIASDLRPYAKKIFEIDIDPLKTHLRK